MPRTRATEIAQKQSPRGQPNPRTSSSDSDQQHPRPRTERTAKPIVRPPQSDPSNQKKLGTRIANLECQLGLAQEELKSLKDQLVSTESAKKSAQDPHDKKPENHNEEKHYLLFEAEAKSSITYETSNDNIQKETDVFEVPDGKLADERRTEVEIPDDDDDDDDEVKSKSITVKDNPLLDELALKNDEINMLKAGLDDKDKELENFSQENASLKSQLDEKSLKISSAQAEIDELSLKLTRISQELEKSETNAVEMSKKLDYTEKAKEELENEMKRLRVQSEQWRKAADAAASVLAGEVEINGRRLSERCGSMDKVYTNSFERVGGYVRSPGLVDDGDDVFIGGEKRRGSGIRMLGELWKKKGQK